MPALSRVFWRDARGHGKSSTPPPYDYSVDTILGEIVDTFDQLGLQQVHFFGEPTGGIFAEALTTKHGDGLLSVIDAFSTDVSASSNTGRAGI